MPKFTKLELDMFAEHKCSTCHFPPEAEMRPKGVHGCPHLAKAFIKGHMPGVWTRRRGATLGSTFACADFTATPPTTRRKRTKDPAHDTEPLFDTTPYCTDPVHLVPVDGWPDYRALKRAEKDTKHA